MAAVDVIPQLYVHTSSVPLSQLNFASALTSQNDFVVLHFATLEMDSILETVFKKKDILKVEHFIEKYLDTDYTLLQKGKWLKKIESRESTYYSLKEAKNSQDFIHCTEYKGEDLKSVLESAKETNIDSSVVAASVVAEFEVTRWIVKVQNTDIYIDSCRTHKEKDRCADYYLVCGCRAKCPQDVQDTLLALGLHINSLLYPVTSKIVEWLMLFDDSAIEKNNINIANQRDFEDIRRIFHRQSNPLTSLGPQDNTDSTKYVYDIKSWICELGYSEDILQQLKKIATEHAADLYSASPQAMMNWAEEDLKDERAAIYGIILYFRLNLWRAPVRCTVEKLLDEVKKNEDFVNSCSQAELELLLQQESQLSSKILNEVAEQLELLVFIKNEFTNWQANSNIDNEHFIIL